MRDGVFFAPDELTGARLAMAQGKDTAIKLACLYRRELAPTFKPIWVEEKIYLDLPEVDLPIVTILDLYTEDKCLRDLKTASKKWTEDKAHSSDQPTAYREAIKQRSGEYPQSISFDVLVSSKTPALQCIPTTRNDDDLAVLARKFQRMLLAIRAGIFLPAEPCAWICSPKFCGYWFTCPYVPPHRKTLPKRSA